MTSKADILDAALDVLRRGDALTIDAVARDAGLTKPGVVHHFATKEVLMLAVFDRLIDRWETQLRQRAGEDADPGSRLRAYAEHALLGHVDAADLALLADLKLRDKLSVRWAERMGVWFGDPHDPRHVAARLIADGAWIDRGLGLLDLDKSERAATMALVASLIEQEVES